MNNLVFDEISYSKRGRGCHGWMMSPQLPACFVRAFLIQKHFYCLTKQTKEERKLDHRVTRLTFPRYCLVLSSIQGEYFNLIMGTQMTSYLNVLLTSSFKKVKKKVLLSNSNIADVYLFVNEITFYC